MRWSWVHAGIQWGLVPNSYSQTTDIEENSKDEQHTSGGLGDTHRKIP